MTKQDYIKIGQKLAEIRPSHVTPESEAGVTWDKVVDGLCKIFREDNSAFKEDRFRDFVNGKCGPNGGAK
jgi:hypothetical protein